MTISKELAKALQDVHRDAERALRALRPRYEEFPLVNDGAPWYLVARETLHFNDGWEEARASS